MSVDGLSEDASYPPTDAALAGAFRCSEARADGVVSAETRQVTGRASYRRLRTNADRAIGGSASGRAARLALLVPMVEKWTCSEQCRS